MRSFLSDSGPRSYLLVTERTRRRTKRRAALAKGFTPFPTLDELPEQSEWPAPPFAWRHLRAPANDLVQLCRVEVDGGQAIEGDMVGFDPVGLTLGFRSSPQGPSTVLPFARFRRLVMTLPLRPAPPIPGAPIERMPAAAQEREYHLQLTGGGELTGRTAGRVETPHGLYLFKPVDEEASLQRQFVPRSAYTECQFGQSAEEIAASRWIATPGALLEALERQQRMPVLPLGHALRELGLLTKDQLARALARQPENVALGDMLVANGLISSTDLKTALAHKMGYPLVDLARFPIEPEAVAKLPRRLALEYRAMPLMLHRKQLIVAVHKPSRAARLLELHGLADVVAVLAPKAQIMIALARQASDMWAQIVPQRIDFFETTQ